MILLGQGNNQKRNVGCLRKCFHSSDSFLARTDCICLQGAKSPRVILSDQSFTDFEIKALPVRSKFQFLNQANYSTQYCFGTPYSALPSPCDAFTITIVL